MSYGGLANTLFSPKGAFGGATSASMGEIIELQKALNENAEAVMKSTVGYPNQGQAFTGSLAPLVPQSIQGTLDSKTFTMKKLVLFPMLRKVSATSPLHETTRIDEHGNSYLDPFISEGGIGPINETTYSRLIVQIKYMAEHIELSDVSILTGILGNKGNMLAERTERGTLSLLGKLERKLVHSSSANSPLAFDGIVKQIEDGAPANVKDYKGQVVTPEDLIEEVAEVQNSPNFGETSLILMDHQAHSALAKIASAHGRHDQFKVTDSSIGFGAKNITINTSQGSIPILSMPLIREENIANAAVLGGTPPPALSGLSPAISNIGTTTGSLFTAAEAGAYRFQVVGVGDGGVTAPISLGPTTVAAGEALRLVIEDTLATGDSTLRYYRVYRSPVGGGAGTETFMGTYPVNNLGTADTHIVDLNANRPGTAMTLILDFETIQWVKMLDFLRRPLAQIVTAVPFLLMLFGALHIPTPTKNMVLKNCGLRL